MVYFPLLLMNRLNDDIDFNRWVGACLSKAGPTMANLVVFFSSDSLQVEIPFLYLITV